MNRFTVDEAVYAKLRTLRRQERDVHDAMLEAPVEEAPVFFAAMHRLRAERTRYLRMLSRPSTADLTELGLVRQVR